MLLTPFKLELATTNPSLNNQKNPELSGFFICVYLPKKLIMYKVLAKINKAILPSFTKQGLDPAKAKKWQKALIAWRYFVTVRALD